MFGRFVIQKQCLEPGSFPGVQILKKRHNPLLEKQFYEQGEQPSWLPGTRDFSVLNPRMPQVNQDEVATPKEGEEPPRRNDQ